MHSTTKCATDSGTPIGVAALSHGGTLPRVLGSFPAASKGSPALESLAPTLVLPQLEVDAAPKPTQQKKTWRPTRRGNRWLDTGIGIAVSAAIHVGLIMMPGESASPKATAVVPPQVVEAVEFDLPEPEPEPVEIADAPPAESLPTSFAPPSQAELPSLVSVAAFVQPMQAPTPTGLAPMNEMIVVPTAPPTVGQGGQLPKLFDIAELDRIPSRIRAVTPTYPLELRRARIEGEVVLIVIIDEGGKVRVDKVVSTTGGEFTAAAVAAAEQCRFQTPMKGGVAVSARYQMRVPFRLGDLTAAR